MRYDVKGGAPFTVTPSLSLLVDCGLPWTTDVSHSSLPSLPTVGQHPLQITLVFSLQPHPI